MAAEAAKAVPEERWARRPALALTVRLLALAIPIAASVATAALLSRAIPRPAGLPKGAAWWLMILVVSTAVLAAVDRAARRLLPLAALLRLSMVFPDRAPSRFWIAFRAGTIRNLKRELACAREHGVDDEPARSAQRILALLGALNVHDRATRGHSERVRAFNDLIAEELGLPDADRDRLRWAALLHDIGKLEVPARILTKPGRPTGDEWERLRRHPDDGARIAAPLRPWLGPWAAAIEQHHERWNGSGYPRGLAGEDISLGARIVAVADVFEVLTAPRPYRRPVSAQAARAELARHANQDFDPVVVRALLNVSLGKLRRAMGPISWLAQLPFLGAVPRLEGAAAAAGRSAVNTAGAATGVGALAVLGLMGPHGGQQGGPHSGPPFAAGPESGTTTTTNPSVAGVPPDPSNPPGTPDPERAPAPGIAPITQPAPARRAGTPGVPGGGDSGQPAPPPDQSGPPAPPPSPTPGKPPTARIAIPGVLDASVTIHEDLTVEARVDTPVLSPRRSQQR